MDFYGIFENAKVDTKKRKRIDDFSKRFKNRLNT